jgi:hypothetical protein
VKRLVFVQLQGTNTELLLIIAVSKLSTVTGDIIHFYYCLLPWRRVVNKCALNRKWLLSGKILFGHKQLYDLLNCKKKSFLEKTEIERNEA